VLPPKKGGKRGVQVCKKRQVEQRLATDAVEMRSTFPAEENLYIYSQFAFAKSKLDCTEKWKRDGQRRWVQRGFWIL